MVRLLQEDAGGVLLRRLLPFSLLIPFALGFLKMGAEHRGWSDAETRTGLLMLTLMVVFSAMLWRTAGQLSGQAAAARAAEEAVSRIQKTFVELVERSPFGTYIVDSQFRVAMMNAASQDGAFRKVRPVIGRDFTDVMRILWPDDVAAEIIAHVRHTLDTGEPYFSRDFVNPRQDAEIVEAYEWELHRMTLPDGRHGVICYYYDSTRLREAEAAVRASEERFRGSPLLDAYRQVAETGQTQIEEARYQGDGVLEARFGQPARYAPDGEEVDRA
jgi:PAS domain-containing protein